MFKFIKSDRPEIVRHMPTYLFPICNVFAADTLRDAVTLSFDTLKLNVCIVSAIM